MIPSDISNIDSLPGCAVLTRQQVAKLIGVSIMTLWELGRDGSGPPMVRLSKKRVGYPVGDFRKWLASRTITGNNAA